MAEFYSLFFVALLDRAKTNILNVKGTVRRYGSRAIARYFTASEIINKRTFTIIYEI